MKSIILGKTTYTHANELQNSIVNKKKSGVLTDDFVLVSEFDHIITLGRNTDEKHIKSSDQMFKDNNIEKRKIDRGGDVTYHGPGQLVIYPIIDLTRYEKDFIEISG